MIKKVDKNSSQKSKKVTKIESIEFDKNDPFSKPKKWSNFEPHFPM